jgi:hypothetical protein
VPIVKPGTAAALQRTLVVPVASLGKSAELISDGKGMLISNRFALAPLPVNAVFNCCIDANAIFIIL